MAKIHIKLTDSIGTDNRDLVAFDYAGTMVCPVSLLPESDYTASIAIEAPDGRLSDYSTPIPVTTFENSVSFAGLVSSGTDIWIEYQLVEDDAVTLEIDTCIDAGEWKSTNLSIPGLQYVTLKSSESDALYAAHDYRYSDGYDHAVSARIRILGHDPWYQTAQLIVKLESDSYPRLVEWITALIAENPIYGIHTEGAIPPGFTYKALVKIDASDVVVFFESQSAFYNYSYQFLSVIPPSYFDGNQHTFFIYADRFNSNNELIDRIALGDKIFQLPLLDSIMPALLQSGSCIAQKHGDEWLIFLEIPNVPNDVIWNVSFSPTTDFLISRNNQNELLIRGIHLPVDGKTHTFSIIYSYNYLGITSSPVLRNLEILSMAANAPSNILVTYKKVKDPITNLQTSYEFTARLTFEQAKLRIQAQVDGGTFTDCAFDVLSNFPPMIRITGVQIPRDAYTHPVVFKMWHVDAVAGDSPAVLSDPVVAVFDMAPPPAPVNVSATVIRNRAGAVPDHVRVSWESDYDVDIVVLDDTGKRRTVGNGAEADADLIIENSSRFGTQDGTARQFRFGVLSKNRSAASAIVYAPPVSLMTTNAAVATQTPDDIAGIAQYMTHSQFLEWLKSEHATTDPAIITSVFTSALTKIKDVIAKGGSVTLSDVGIFRALWTDEKTVFRNGQYVSIPPVRNADFSLSVGFQKGTKLGQVMTDTEAALF